MQKSNLWIARLSGIAQFGLAERKCDVISAQILSERIARWLYFVDDRPAG